MFASGHQAPALQALPKHAAQSLRIHSLLGKHNSARLQRRSQHSLSRAQQSRPHLEHLAVCQSTDVAAPVTEKVGLDARVAVVLGTQWGDEGKGKLVDILAQKYEIVARAQVGFSILGMQIGFSAKHQPEYLRVSVT